MSLPKFNPERISDISHYVAPRGSTGGPKDPQLILIFGWFGARLSQLMDYSSTFAELYPAASQVIIESDMVWAEIGSETNNINRLQPILAKLTQLGLFGERPPRMLIHVLSGGGVAQLLRFALALDSGPPWRADTRPLTCLVIDSAPGSYHHADAQRVLTYSLTGFKKLVGLAVAALIYMGLHTRSYVTGRPMPHEFIRDGLSNPQILPWTDTSTPRLYLYSDADRTSLPSDVEAHIEPVKRNGLNVREELFVGTEHVQHSREYPERYWNAIRSIWDDRIRSKL